METWTTILVALIVALSTLGATFIQSWHSNKRFKIELGRAIDVDARKRRWEVRGEPLLKLRTELAIMATKQDRVVSAAHKLHTRFGMTKEEAEQVLKNTVDSINTYLESGNFNQTLFMQFDKEIVDKVEEIIMDYRASYIDAIYYKDLKATELGEAMKVFDRNKNRIMEVQSLINKRLEEL